MKTPLILKFFSIFLFFQTFGYSQISYSVFNEQEPFGDNLLIRVDDRALYNIDPFGNEVWRIDIQVSPDCFKCISGGLLENNLYTVSGNKEISEINSLGAYKNTLRLNAFGYHTISYIRGKVIGLHYRNGNIWGDNFDINEGEIIVWPEDVGFPNDFRLKGEYCSEWVHRNTNTFDFYRHFGEYSILRGFGNRQSADGSSEDFQYTFLIKEGECDEITFSEFENLDTIDFVLKHQDQIIYLTDSGIFSDSSLISPLKGIYAYPAVNHILLTGENGNYYILNKNLEILDQRSQNIPRGTIDRGHRNSKGFIFTVLTDEPTIEFKTFPAIDTLVCRGSFIDSILIEKDTIFFVDEPIGDFSLINVKVQNGPEIVNNEFDEDCDGVIVFTDQDNDGFTFDEDCNDNNPNINPGVSEIPNNDIDEDCDGNALQIDEDNDGFNSDEDCDDSNPDINILASEIPNNDIDENCDGFVLYDQDLDGYSSQNDCDDNNPNINPGAVEILNNDIDENCDGINAYDLDEDGFDSLTDCDDMNPDINPNAAEIPNNNIDENCDGFTMFIDQDGDGFNSDEDCNDLNHLINPDAQEIPDNDIDENCDGLILKDADEDGFYSDEDCDDNNADINPSAMEIPNNDIDEDCDGIALQIDEDNDGFNSDEDCDDNNADINPSATEIPNNDIDEDCDGIALQIDEDNDGFNSDEDCDDKNPNINPGAVETPDNGIDEDCDGMDATSSVYFIEGSKIEIFPNPVSDFLKIQIAGDQKFSYCISDLKGQILLKGKLESELSKIDLAGLISGTYFLKIESGKEKAIIKVVKI